MAEDNEDWIYYYSLRPKLITAWNEIKPEIANLYRNTNTAEQDNINTEAPKFTNPYSSQIQSPLWGNDIIVHSGGGLDMSLVVSRNDTLYLGVLELSGTSISIYASGDGGSTWSLLNCELAAGNHEVNFNASKLSSGIYFYRIETTAFISTKKLILIK